MRLITILNKKQTRKQANRQYVVKVWYIYAHIFMSSLCFIIRHCVRDFAVLRASFTNGKVLTMRARETKQRNPRPPAKQP